MKDFEDAQKKICQKYRVSYHPLDFGLKLGVSDDFFSSKMPLNGLRHPPEGDTCGWYLWAGEDISTAADYFKPMHVFHLVNRRQGIIPYLALPAGWRFLVADNYEDVWI
jgi:hypothetical protein